MGNNSQSRKWALVINNPLEAGLDHSTIKEILQRFSPAYYCMGDEIASTGTYHTHLFFYAPSPVRFSTVKNRFPTAHIEKAYGTVQDNRAYIRKDGQWADTDKAETSVPGTFEEWGEIPPERAEKHPEMFRLVQNIRDGMTTTEIIDDNPAMAFRVRDIDLLRQTLTAEKYAVENRPLQVSYLYGASGAGKTRSIYETHDPRSIYRVTNYRAARGVSFDGYHGQEVLVFEEFSSQIPIEDMLNYLDIYPLALPARYNDKTACYTMVYISKRVKRGHQKSIQKGHVLGCRMWGYKKVNCKLEIDEKTAPMVRRIFELYATNQYSMKEIEEIIFQEGYRNNNGNRLSHTTMSNIITNPKYKGYFVGGKVKVIDIFNKRQKFLPEDEWLMYKDEDGTTVPALVSEELWQAANEVFKRRSIDVKGRRNCSTHKNIYTGKLYCTEDGAPYYCKDVHYKGTNVSKWLCSHKINHGTASCRSIAIYESELNPIILDAFREFSKGADEILATYLEQYRQVMDDTAHYKTERERIAKELSSIDEKQDQLLDMKVSGDLTLDEFKRMMDKTRAQKAELEKALDSMANWEEIAEQMEAQVERLKRALSFKLEDLEDGMINRDFVDNFIKRIDVTPNSDRQISLKIHLLTGEIVQKELEKIKGRTGQLSKKMIESYEKNL